MKILILTTKYFPAVGGLETAVRNIAAGLHLRGHEVVIATNQYSRELKKCEAVDQILVHRYFFSLKPPITLNLWIWMKYIVRVSLFPITLIRFKNLIDTFNPDIVHLHYVADAAYYLQTIHKKCKFKWVASLHGADIENYENKTGFEKKCLAITFRSANFITANAKHLLEEAFQKTGSYRQEIAIVPMAFSPASIDKPKPCVYPRAFIFSAGRFVSKKGFDVLIQAFSGLLKQKSYSGNLLLAGDGEELELCKQLTKKLGIGDRVRFLGVLSQPELASYLDNCDFFVMPSRLEAFGIACLEALYAGKKVIASKIGGLIDIMKDNPSWLVEPGDPHALAKKMEGAIRGHLTWNPVPKEKLKEDYSWDKTIEAYLGIYEKLLEKKSLTHA